MSRYKSLKGKRILVTGGMGFIGQKFLTSLKGEGARVRILDVRNNDDICEYKTLTSIKDRIDIVYHLAAITYVPYSWEHPRETLNTNLIGTINMLELCRSKKIKKLVYMSSYVYGQPEYLPIDEDHPVRPANPYAWSKYIGESICRAYFSNFGINCVILRPFNIYGTGQNQQFLIPSIYHQIKKWHRVILDNAYPKRDFMHVDDMVKALVSAGKYDSLGVAVFNIGYGKSYSVREIAQKMIDITGEKASLTFRERRRKGEVLDVVADTTKAHKYLKWRPNIGIEEGLRKLIFDNA